MSATIIKVENDGTLSFGDYKLAEKTKVSDFAANGGSYKVKTFNEMTKLEKDELFVFESVPGTAVSKFTADDDGMSFCVTGAEPAQLTLGLWEDAEYEVFIDDVNVGRMTTNISGKLNMSVELAEGREVAVKVVRR